MSMKTKLVASIHTALKDLEAKLEVIKLNQGTSEPETVMANLETLNASIKVLDANSALAMETLEQVKQDEEVSSEDAFLIERELINLWIEIGEVKLAVFKLERELVSALNDEAFRNMKPLTHVTIH